ncbi:Hypothetical predicted protein [Mytilus galloprovincialis]|uniref:Uncharacterized protein n=1 Tax=Mytilus galloprovincialis TaxID=29158 RepID=A0A8B6GTG5_MYTGA|nr:Hypothetical predicted protein [Mytilus galloprovincialis]
MADQTNINPCPPKLPRLRKTKYSVAEENLIQEGAIKINSLRVTYRTGNEIRDKWRNTVSKANKAFTEQRREVSKTGGGPPPKPIPPQFEAVIDLMKDSSSFTGIDEGLETDIRITGKHNTSHSDDDLFTTPLASPATDTTDTVAETPSPKPSTSPGFVPNTLPSKPVSTKTVVESSHHPENAKQAANTSGNCKLKC